MSAPVSAHSASYVALSDLGWSTPDGRPVFSGLSLSFGPGRTALVGRNGSGKSTLLQLIAGDISPASGSVARRGRVAMLRQQLEPAPGALVADMFGAREALTLLRLAEAGTATVEQLALCDWMLESRIGGACARLGLTLPLDTPLSQLSGGQRTRAAIAALLADAPDILLLDEPSNHLDAEGRMAVAELLQGWRGVAIIASHDRALLESVDRIIDLSNGIARTYGGGWGAWKAQKAEEEAAAEQRLDDAGKALSQAKRMAARNAEKQARRDGAGHRKGQKGDMPAISAGLRKRQAEATSGQMARVADDRINAAGEALSAARERIETVDPLTVAMPSTGLSPGRRVLELEAVSAGYSADVLQGLSLTISGPERVAVTGRNGSGKSTLLALVAGKLAPSAGTARVQVPCALLDQDVSLLNPAFSICDNFQQLNPGIGENELRAALARFMFRADAALRPAGSLSGGERLRAGLACVLGVKPPPLLLLDEPSNHLDLESMEAVEQGLLRYDGALLVVSHDEAFLQAIGISRRIALG